MKRGEVVIKIRDNYLERSEIVMLVILEMFLELFMDKHMKDNVKSTKSI
jgi:hypothetical protein